MTLAELKQLKALLEQASQHADQQAAYTPNSEASDIWKRVANDCGELLYSLHAVLLVIEEAMNDEV